MYVLYIVNHISPIRLSVVVLSWHLSPDIFVSSKFKTGKNFKQLKTAYNVTFVADSGNWPFIIVAEVHGSILHNCIWCVHCSFSFSVTSATWCETVQCSRLGFWLQLLYLVWCCCSSMKVVLLPSCFCFCPVPSPNGLESESVAGVTARLSTYAVSLSRTSALDSWEFQ